MQKQHVYCLVIALGIVAPIVSCYLCQSTEEKLDPPEVLSERVLNEDSTEAQVEAARELVRYGEPTRTDYQPAARREIRRALARSHGKDPEVRKTLLQAAMKMRDWRSVPEVFKAMEDPDPAIRGRAGAAARIIMGADFYFRANDPPEKRAEIIAVMKREYERMQSIYPIVYPDQEGE